MSRRASRIKVPATWLTQVEEFRREHAWSLEELGKRAAAAVHRARPFSHATLSRYIAGDLVTDELTTALAVLMSAPEPMPSDPRHVEWAQLGMRLDVVDQELFDRELEDLRTMVTTLEARRQRRK